MRFSIYHIAFTLAFGILLSCNNQELRKITVNSTLEASFFNPSSNSSGLESTIGTSSLSYTLPDRLNDANVSTGNISAVQLSNMTLTLEEPADSTFTIFTQLDVYLKNGADSLLVAKLSDENAQTTRTLQLRRLFVNSRDYLIDNSLSDLTLIYTLNTDEVDTVSITLTSDWMATGEVE